MQQIARQLILEAASAGLSDVFRGEIFEYASELDLQNGYAVKGRFDVSRSKYLIEPMRALKNRRIRQVVIMKAVQTGGSLLADLWVPYVIEHAPGDLLWLFQDDDFAKTYMDERFLPLLRRIASLRRLIEAAGRFGVTKDALLLPHMSVMIGGLNANNVQSLSKRYVIIDECWLALNNGLIRQAKARTSAFPYTKKILLVSQAGVEGDDFDLEWQQSDGRYWNWQCPSCKKHQPFEMSVRREDGSWAGMKWDTNETTRRDGRWNYPAVAKTARLECVACGHAVDDTPAKRRLLDDTHQFVASNPSADDTIAGFHWPAIANVDVSFASFVTAYLQAKVQQEQHGYILPLVEFTQKQLAKPWSVDQSIDLKRFSHEPYEINSKWPDERYRFMTVDCQKDFKEFWFVIRAWALTGESRQLDRGRLESWEQIAAKQREWGVQDQRVFVDCGYEQTKVAEECVKHGHEGWITISGTKRKVWRCWVALKGSRQEIFQHRDSKTKLVANRIFSEVGYLSPNIGKRKSEYHCPVISFSVLHVSDILRRHRDGEAAKWLCLPDTAEKSDLLSFTNQMQSHVRMKERDEKGNLVNLWKPVSMGGEQKFSKKRPGHYWDCEKMQKVAALNYGIIGGSSAD